MNINNEYAIEDLYNAGYINLTPKNSPTSVYTFFNYSKGTWLLAKIENNKYNVFYKDFFDSKDKLSELEKKIGDEQ